MNRARMALLAVVTVLGTILATSASAFASGTVGGPVGKADQTIYLSLGDSLSQGVQPLGPSGANVVTDQGYPDQLLAIEAATHQPLNLVKMGCPGEDTTTMRFGGNPLCTYTTGSQLGDAVQFLTAHRNHMAFVTLDIGGNDLNSCASLGGPGGITFKPPACIAAAFGNIKVNLTAILTQLKAADPNVLIVGMNYFNPYLAVWLRGGFSEILAQITLGIADTLSAWLGGIYAAFGVAVADVASAFSTDAFCLSDQLIPGSIPCPWWVPFPHPPSNLAPLDVVRICQWTWMCAPAPRGPNIHPNQAGYAVIATAFAPLIHFGEELQQ